MRIELKQIGDAVVSAVRAATGALQKRLDDFEVRLKAIPAGPKGDAGQDGKDAPPVDIDAVVQRAVALIPAPLNGKDGAAGLPGKSAYGLAVERGFAGTELQWLDSLKGERGDKGERGESIQGLKGDKGDRGDDGKSIQGERGEKGDVGLRGEKGEPGPVGPQGVPGEKGGCGEPGDVGPAGRDAEIDYERVERAIREVVQVAVQEEVKKAVALIPVPKDGRDGKDGASGVDGKDATVDEGAIVERVRALIPTPKDGRDGESVDFDAVVAKAVSLIPVPTNGVDGKSVSLEDLRPILEAETARWQLEFERRASDILRDAVEKMPKPADGKDGMDALSVDDFDVSLEGRVFTFALRCGERVVQKQIKVPYPQDCGVYRVGRVHEKGDVVTFGGSQWISLTDDNDTKPPSDKWRLCVSRGKDGKDAA